MRCTLITWHKSPCTVLPDSLSLTISLLNISNMIKGHIWQVSSLSNSVIQFCHFQREEVMSRFLSTTNNMQKNFVIKLFVLNAARWSPSGAMFSNFLTFLKWIKFPTKSRSRIQILFFLKNV
jgi:hypothetical protein